MLHGSFQIHRDKVLRCFLMLFVCLRLRLVQHFVSAFFRAPQVQACFSIFLSDLPVLRTH